MGLKKRRVIVYVDGFNLYHAIDDLNKPHLKWLNLHALSSSLINEGEELVGVKYFSAYATWKPEKHKKHIQYVNALKAHGVIVDISKFKEKKAKCHSCGATWKSHEEKESDVKISIQLVTDAFDDAFDRAIVISADSDLVPPKRLIESRFPRKTVFVVAPPGRFSTARDLGPKLEITKGRLNKNLFPDVVFNQNGEKVATKPSNWV